jgi:hypothetical protein
MNIIKEFIMRVSSIFLIISYVWFLIVLHNIIDFQAELKLVNRNLKFQIVALLEENNPELDGEQLKIKVNEIYKVISGN